MNLEEFTTRLNSDIVGKLVNIASRCAGFIARSVGGMLAARAARPRAVRASSRPPARRSPPPTRRATTPAAMREIMALADRANQYIDQRKPWELAKQPGQRRRGAGRVHARA